MASQPAISIPSTSLSPGPDPHTRYNITIQLPLHPLTISKRYSDFQALHSALSIQSSPASPPPHPLPAKSWFTRTISSPALTETRRQGLEAYLHAINTNPDDRWRATSAWRSFLNLPSSSLTSSTANSSRSTLHPGSSSSANGAAASRIITTDPVLWLDQHKALKGHLHEARLALTKRDQQSASAAGGGEHVTAQHEAAARAKKALVRAGTLIAGLEKGLDGMKKGTLGEGEVRRRRDLIAMARKEREGLERLEGKMALKGVLDQGVAGHVGGEGGRKEDLLGLAGGRARGKGGGRVLGKETEQTRALDNEGVVMLQRQLMQGQDQDLEVLAQAVRRQKELGVQIQEELEVQKDLLGLVDEDVERVEGKLGVARKRAGKIS